MKKKITIAGCGVIGLSTGLRLLEEGYEVALVTRDFPKHTTSNKAAAFWFPYHVRDSAKILDWSVLSYQKFEALASIAGSGVHLVPVIKLGNEINEIEQRIRATLRAERFRPLRKDELMGGFDSGWHIMVPLIETPVYLPYLFNAFVAAGGKITVQTIQSLDELLSDTTIVVNCTGLAARELADDKEVIPVRGQIVLLKAENRHRIVLEDLAPTYIVYRTDGCVCGGTYEMQCEEMLTEPDTLQKIRQRCVDLDPSLKDAAVIDSWAGLRPYRADIRVEQETGKALIHNYGHGGSGFTVSWGCAEEVVGLIERMQQ